MHEKLGIGLAISAVIAVWLARPGLLEAQTIAPVIAEYRGKAQGRFEIVNPGLRPITVTLEPMSFAVDREGRATYVALDASLHVRLSATGFRVGPQEAYTVFYEASAERRPAWFTIYATVTGARPGPGLQVAMRLPHTVYLLTREILARDSVAFLGAGLDSARRIGAEIENRGSRFGRVRAVEVWSGGNRTSYAGFPLFPGQQRTLRLDWTRSSAPERMVLKFDHFDIAQAISP